MWASPLLCQGDPEVEDYIYPAPGGAQACCAGAGGGGKRHIERGLIRMESTVCFLSPAPHPHSLVPLPTAAIRLQRLLAFLLSARIKSGKMAGKVLAQGFSAKLN